MLDSLMAKMQRLRRQLSSDNFTLKKFRVSRADEKSKMSPQLLRGKTFTEQQCSSRQRKAQKFNYKQSSVTTFQKCTIRLVIPVTLTAPICYSSQKRKKNPPTKQKNIRRHFYPTAQASGIYTLRNVISFSRPVVHSP